MPAYRSCSIRSNGVYEKTTALFGDTGKEIVEYYGIMTASTYAKVLMGAVITCKDKLWKGPVFGTPMSFAVLNPAYTMSEPPMQVFSGGFDTLSHTTETDLGSSDKDKVSEVSVISYSHPHNYNQSQKRPYSFLNSE